MIGPPSPLFAVKVILSGNAVKINYVTVINIHVVPVWFSVATNIK